MKNVYEVLRQKELELSKLEKEVEALRVAAPLLSDDKEAAADTAINKPTLASASPVQQPIRLPQPAVSAAPQPAQMAYGAGGQALALVEPGPVKILRLHCAEIRFSSSPEANFGLSLFTAAARKDMLRKSGQNRVLYST
jgi:hypothetical protein